MSWPKMASRVVCSILEFALAADPEHTLLVPSHDRTTKMKNDSFSGLDPVKRPLWSILPLEDTLTTVVCCPRLRWEHHGAGLWKHTLRYREVSGLGVHDDKFLNNKDIMKKIIIKFLDLCYQTMYITGAWSKRAYRF